MMEKKNLKGIYIMFPYEKIMTSQQHLDKANIDGWLFYDFRKTNDLACNFLEISSEMLLTRRFFYWIPRKGQPIKIVHRIEVHTLEHLPGKILEYSSWQELEANLREVLSASKRIVMEYSPNNAIPYVSKVDGGTIDLVRKCGVEIQSSADILQQYTSVWTAEQLSSHLAAADVLDQTVDKAWLLIAESIKKRQALTEWDIQQYILKEFDRLGCVTADAPICAVNGHTANPHYSPDKHRCAQIKRGDFILIDLWCKKNTPKSVYADITRVGVANEIPTKRQQEIFQIVKDARDAAMDFLKKRISLNQMIMGWEVDQVCRDVIEKAGYGKFFTHRTGHNIGERDHGDGANIDNLETKDSRRLLPGSCFSIEPGIYLPGEFGVRLEHDVYLELDGKGMRVTGGLQKEIVCVL